MGKRTRRINRAHGKHKLPGESKKEFRKRMGGQLRPEQASTRTPRNYPGDISAAMDEATEMAHAGSIPSQRKSTSERAKALHAEQARKAWEDMTVPELRTEAKAMGLKGYSRMVRGELLDRMAELAHNA